MATQRHKASAPRSLSATDGSDVSPQCTPPGSGSLEMPHLLEGDRQSSMPAADLSDLDDRVTRLVTLKMAEMLPSAKSDRRCRKEAKARLSHDDHTDSQWEEYDLSSDSVALDLDTTFGQTSRKRKHKHRHV